jgi:hypothetical protein
MRRGGGGARGAADNSTLSAVGNWQDELAVFAMCRHGFCRAECDPAVAALNAAGAVVSDALLRTMAAALAVLAAQGAAEAFTRDDEASGRDGGGSIDEIAAAAAAAAARANEAVDADELDEITERRTDELLALRAILDEEDSDDEEAGGAGAGANESGAEAARGKRVVVRASKGAAGAATATWSLRLEEVDEAEAVSFFYLPLHFTRILLTV